LRVFSLVAPGGDSVRLSPLVSLHRVRRPLLALWFPVACVLAVACGDDSASTPPTVEPAAQHASPEPPAGSPAPEGIEGVIAVTGLTNNHTEDDVDYPTYPPMGGDHYPVWLNCGFYDKIVPDAPAVHDLEHGAIWIAYRPDATDAQLQQLKALADGETHILVSQYPGLRAPFVLTAWGRQLDLDDIADPRFQQFIDTYIRAGDAPEPGAACEGGLQP
jgi:hypothetical protein